MIDGKKVLFSGMQATGNLTLGNYLGALKNWLTLSDEYECFYSVVDLHSITVRQNPAELRKRARNLLTLYIAAGLDPKKNCIYYQSHVSGHAELSWILSCFTSVSYTHLCGIASSNTTGGSSLRPSTSVTMERCGISA